MSLRLAADLELPDDLVTQSIAILARRGAGKTYAASVLVEEVIRERLPVVVLDPTGAWWGLRSSVDGRKPGLPVVIFGGDHGDVPLESTAGSLLADVVIDHPGAYIIDLSGLPSRATEQRFAGDFLDRLYRRKGRDSGPLLVVVDEADIFAPQRPGKEQLRTLGALESIVRRGRIKGLGDLLISQRAAVLNKNVLTQTEVLVIMQTTGPQDRAAIDAWVEGNGTGDERAAVLGSLAALHRGEAWIWSPSFLRTLRRIHIRPRLTFDSSRTPKPGETPIAPQAFAPVDLEVLGERILATREQAKANDPGELRRRIMALEREVEQQRRVAEAAAAIAPEVRVERVEVPVLNGQVHELRAAIGEMTVVAAGLVEMGRSIEGAAQSIVAAIDRVTATPRERQVERAPRGVPAGPAGDRAQTAVATLAPAAPRRAPAPAEARTLGRAERSLLSVLAAFPDGRTRIQLSILSGYSIKSSSFANALGALRSSGLAEGRELIVITDAGREAAGDVEPVPTGTALLDHWRGQLGKAERGLLNVLVEAYPDELTREELSERSGYSLTSSSFANAIGRLRSLQLITGLRASDDLFGGAS